MDREASAALGGRGDRSILESADRLGRFPYMGHIGKTPDTYEWVVPGLPYILVYEVHPADDLVAVAAVFHGAQDRENRE